MKICLKSVTNAIYNRKSAADKIATEDHVNSIWNTLSSEIGSFF